MQDRLPPEPGVFIYNNLGANSQSLKDLYHTCDIFALPTFADRSSFGSWLHGIAYHTYVDWSRRNRLTEPRSQEWWAHQVAAQPGPDEIALRNDLAATVYASVDQLAPDLRDTVHLHYYQELTLQETAEAMGVATSTVKYRLRQALDTLESKFNSQPTPLKVPATSRTL
jgi:RNA polymerase sigma factor (sigma-70 family)